MRNHQTVTRRKFLASSSGLLAIPGLSFSATKACPPNILSAYQGTTSTTSCPNNPTPVWFTNMQDKTWSTPVSNTLDNVKDPLFSNNTAIPLMEAWTTATFDESRGEFLMCAQGGHGDYAGNETYALKIKQTSPSWSRLNNASSPSGGSETTGVYGDGKPRANHGYNTQVFANNRIWRLGMPAVSSSGTNYRFIWAFNRSTLQWENYGDDGTKHLAGGWANEGSCAYDAGTNCIYSIYNYANDEGIWRINVLTGEKKVYPNGCQIGYSWSVVIPESRAWIVGGGNPEQLWVFDLDTMTKYQPQTTGSGSPRYGAAGAVYHAASKSILCWNGNDAANLQALRIPSNPFTGTYTWETIIPSQGNTTIPSVGQTNNLIYGKMRLIEDMGNGQSAIVLVTSTQQGGYLYKLPIGGI